MSRTLRILVAFCAFIVAAIHLLGPSAKVDLTKIDLKKIDMTKIDLTNVDTTFFLMIVAGVLVLSARNSSLSSIEIFGMKLGFEQNKEGAPAAPILSGPDARLGPTSENGSLLAADSYTSIVVKLFPVEMFVAYLTALRLFEASSDRHPLYLWLLFAAFLTATPFVYGRFVSRGQALMLTLSFVCYAYALGGAFAVSGLYNSTDAAVLIVTWTLLCPILFSVMRPAFRFIESPRMS